MGKTVRKIADLLSKIDTHKLASVIIAGVFVLLLVLSFTRNAIKDENLYMQETMLISELLKKGEWIGDYGVGIHGFLFKLPVAFIFMFTGPNIYVATVFTYILSALTAFFMLKILREEFKLNGWGLAGIVIFITSLYFIKTTPTYLREIPALFTVVLFIYYFLQKKNNWILGLILLIMFDAKEHVFYSIGFGYGLWIILDGILSHKNWIERIKYIVFEGFKAFVPVLIWQILMFTTHLIPINMFNASILGLNDKGFHWNKIQFSVNVATINQFTEDGTKEIFQISDTFIKNVHDSDIIKSVSEKVGNVPVASDLIEYSLWERVLEVINVGLKYLGKTLYPESFSFNSVPKIIILPALATSILFFKYWLKDWKSNRTKAMLSVLLWTYILIYIVRISLGRYLLPITPVIVLFFVLFVRDVLYNTKVAKWILIATAVYSLAGLFFEIKLIEVKFIFNVILFGLLFLILYLNSRKSHLNQLAMLIFVSVLGFICGGTAMWFFITQGQLYHYFRWGESHQVTKVVREFESDEIILLNDPGWDILPKVYRYDMSLSPTWKWGLKSYLPKQKMVKFAGETNTYVTEFQDVNDMKIFAKEAHVAKIGIIKSELEEIVFPMQKYIPLLENRKWVKLEKTVELKNAKLYIFDVVEERLYSVPK